MATFILQRLSQALFVLLAAALASFVLLRYVGDPVNNMVGQAASLADREAMRQALGLDQPVILQFAEFLRDAVTGDLGVSYRFGIPVSKLLMERLPATLELSVCAMLVATLLGVPLGVWTALHRRSVVSHIAACGLPHRRGFADIPDRYRPYSRLFGLARMAAVLRSRHDGGARPQLDHRAPYRERTQGARCSRASPSASSK